MHSNKSGRRNGKTLSVTETLIETISHLPEDYKHFYYEKKAIRFMECPYFGATRSGIIQTLNWPLVGNFLLSAHGSSSVSYFWLWTLLTVTLCDHGSGFRSASFAGAGSSEKPLRSMKLTWMSGLQSERAEVRQYCMSSNTCPYLYHFYFGSY